MEYNNGIGKRARELFAEEVQEEKANRGWKYNRNLLETGIDSLVTIGLDGKITDVNYATEKATGLPREKIIGTDFSEYFTEPDKARVGYKQVFEIGKVVDYELYLKHINGSSIPVLYNASVSKDNEGQIIGVFAAARDISAIKKYEDELIDFKNNLELIVQQKTAELINANKELAFQNEEKEKCAAELIIANEELLFQNREKEKRAAELVIANEELAFQNDEKDKRAAELVLANRELVFQTGEKADRAAELVIADKELAFQTGEKADRAAELLIANRELIHQNEEKDKRAAELIVANKELVFQNEEKEKRAAELGIANKELLFQNEEKKKRAAELVIANKELLFQNEEKEKRAVELIIANEELLFQNKEKEKRAAELLNANRELLESQRIAHIGTWRLDAETNQVVWSDELYKMYGFDPSIPPPPYTEHMKLFTPESWKKLSTALEITRTSGIPYELELETLKADGSNGWMWVRGEADKDSRGNIVSLRGAAQDITNRKRNEAELEYERNMAQMYLETAGVMIIALDKEGKISLINREGCEILKVKKEDILGKIWIDSFVLDSARKDVKQVFDKIISGDIEVVKNNELSIVTANKEKKILFWHNSVLHDTMENIIGLLSSGTDITERKQAEKALAESENLFRTSFENATAGIVMVAKDGTFSMVNDRACELWGYTREELLQLHYNDITYEEDQVIGTISVNKMISGELNHAALEKRYIKKDGTVIWALVSISAIRDEMNNVKYFITYIHDITDSKAVTERINGVLEGTIETLALVVEARDPYTSGHQKRVAEIAVAIAEDMGLSKGQVRGLYLASIIHDLGKIQVPSEILSKPGKLTYFEFEMIKCHPETAYNLLKDIDFPWPVAEIIYQHHERIDGSGYPRKLKGDSISIEAKILGVADVVEAMSSHRPYRAAFPKDTALAEIEKNKGVLYDPAVVEACLKVLIE